MSEQREPGSSSPGRSRLCDFIREHHALILERWAQQVRVLPSARELSHPQLLDHLPELLERMACAIDRRLDSASCGFEEAPVVHALSRLDEGYDLEEVVGEYALLRACIIQFYREHLGGSPELTESLAEMERFNRLLDETVAVAVSRYAWVRERTLATLDRITQQALGTEGLDTLLPRLLHAVLETTESVDSVTLLLREGDTLRVRASVGLEEEVVSRYSVRVGEGFSGAIAARQRPMELHNASEDPLVRSPAIRHRGVRALYGVPLIDEGQVIGVAHMGSRTAHEFSEEDKLLFRAMAGRATSLILQAQALERERAAREELATREQLLRLVIEQSGDAILMADEHGVLRIFNAEAERQHGMMRRQVTAAEWASTYGLLSPEGRPLPLEETPLYRALHGERVVDARWLVRRPDGQVRLLSGTASPLRRPDGSLAGAVLLSRDETERVQQEGALRQTAEFRERFLGIVSHDLRNPLGAITLSARTLLRTEGLSELQSRAVQRIVAGAERMGRMINELLDLTRARLGGGIPLSRQPVELRGLCQQVLEELETAHPGRRLQVHAEGNLQGEWDADRLSQLLGNLVKNALDYSPEGTLVSLSVVDEGECVRLEVHNQGPPIPEEHLASLFDPFRRAPHADGSASSGLGLGLFIAEQIARAHGGSIAVHSSAGAGTTFSVRLPRHAPRQSEPAC